MICFSYLCQKNCFQFPFFVQNGPNKTIFKRFFRTTRLKHNLLILIESPNIFNRKSVKKSKVSEVFEAKFGPDMVECCEKTPKKSVFQWGFS